MTKTDEGAENAAKQLLTSVIEKQKTLPPLFDNITDDELKEQSMEMAELVSEINALRMKQLEGGGLTDDEVKQGISLIVQVRRMRAGKTAQNELPNVIAQKLEDLF